jgi:peptide/nickel transport system substrate-binding protein
MAPRQRDPGESAAGTGGARLTRRQVLELGGAAAGAVGLSWLLAACGGGDEAVAPAPATQTGETSPAPASTTAPATTAAPAGAAQVDEITWVLPSDIGSLDPAFAYDFSTNPVVTNVCESLLRFTPDGQLEPNLAESWEEVDPTTYVYRLRQGVKYHDGSEMTAEDAAFCISRILDPDVASYLTVFTGSVASAEATGPYELTVKLSSPDALWKYAPGTTAGAVAPKAFLEQAGDALGTPEGGLIGTGPYRFVSWTRAQELVIERFDDYWNQDRALGVARVSYRVIEDEATTTQALTTGEADGTFGLSGKVAASLQGSDSLQIVSAPSYAVHFLGINVEREPFSDARLRQALSYAINKQGALEAVWGGQGEISKSPVTKSLWTFSQDVFQAAYDQLPGYELDLDAAKALVEESGAANVAASILVATPWQEELGIATQAAGQELGFDLQLEKLTLQDLYARILAAEGKDYDMFIVDWASDYPDPAGTLNSFLSTNVVTNEAVYKNPQVDDALNTQRASTDPQERAELLTQAEALIVADQPWIIYYSPNVLMPLNKRLVGYDLRALWYWDSWAADLSGA